ncbi:hypothetical protein MTBBW1_1640004 [Desulfamplus magnetovallimortis]|uniref:Co-chaperone DjlA N-terminal domain-containing protein n=1 Tax=Desulfamplus magnetovallimortis TaxID=1246637 RepID=A0A1W1H923_9BACT|nr:tellurite resistance TerB family protein [Desulfamplus magnetovallimortis]SLM28949.1 hypothetical protein MTBBW1_1640004 [Desulfamplus magnetovallimortis]
MIKTIGEMINQTKQYFELGMDKLSDLLIEEDVARASMVLAAWVSAADGSITESEVSETIKFIKETDFFEEKDHKTLIKEYRKWCEAFINDSEDALLYAFAEIAPLAHKPEAVNAVLLAYRIAKSDNEISESELKIITKACIMLGVKCYGESECVLRE